MALRTIPPHRITGNYEPTIVAGTNLNTATLANAFYTINGQCVQAHATVVINAIAFGFIDFTLSLPFGIDITAKTDLIGHTTTTGWGHVGGTVQGDITNDLAAAQGQLPSPGTHTIYLHFAYIMK
jgi:hypothetical protein